MHAAYTRRKNPTGAPPKLTSFWEQTKNLARNIYVQVPAEALPATSLMHVFPCVVAVQHKNDITYV